MFESIFEFFFGKSESLKELLSPFTPVRTTLQAIELFKKQNEKLYKEIGEPIISFENCGYAANNINLYKCRLTWVLGDDVCYLEANTSAIPSLYVSSLTGPYSTDNGMRAVSPSNPTKTMQYMKSQVVPSTEEIIKAIVYIFSIREGILKLMWNNS